MMSDYVEYIRHKQNLSPQINDIVVVNKSYSSEAPDSIALRRGDLVEVLKTESISETGISTESKYVIARWQDDSDVDDDGCVRFVCLHSRWLVRLFDGSANQKDFWVPVGILDTQQMGDAVHGDKANDATYRREWVPYAPDATVIVRMIERCVALANRAVVRELIETEEEFGRDLLLVVEHYIKVLDNPKTPKLVSDNKDLIFGNFKQIAEFHNTYVDYCIASIWHLRNPIISTKTTEFWSRVSSTMPKSRAWLAKRFCDLSATLTNMLPTVVTSPWRRTLSPRIIMFVIFSR